MLRKTFGVLLAGLGFAAIVAPASAHHSGAWFDRTKVISVQGTVAQIEWRNPHFWVHIDVPDAGGKTVRWSLEGPSSSQVVDNGITPDILKVGQKLTAFAFAGRDPSKHHGSIRGINVSGK